jgi:hypothetical protein
MKICPDCYEEIPTADIDVENDDALCRACDESFSLVELLEESPAPAVDISRPPKGAWYHQTAGGFEVGTSTRHEGAYLILFFIALLPWAMVKVYTRASALLKGFPPNIVKFVFIVAGILLSIAPVSVILMYLFGKIVVSVDKGEGRIFTGVGNFGRTKRFKWGTIKAVREIRNPKPLIELKSENPVWFGSLLARKERRLFLIAVLRKQLRDLRG